MDLYRISDFRLCKLILQHFLCKKKMEKLWFHSSFKTSLLSYSHIFHQKIIIFFFALGLSVRMSVTTKESQIN